MIPSPEKSAPIARRLIVAHLERDYKSQVSRHFRRRGWEVHLAASGPDARRLARKLAPATVVLSTELPDESGWLTSAKLQHEHPPCRVILVTDDPRPDSYLFTAFVGAAALVRREDGPAALEEELVGVELSAVG